MNQICFQKTINPLVSIIVPIYQVEPFLDKCIQALVDQTYYNIEIILVDDGSPDRCRAIIDKYSQIDRRIIPIYKKNQGVSAARNDGIRCASGEYIMFVDGDDYVEPDYVEYFLNLLRKFDCEMAVSSRFLINDENRQNEDTAAVVDSTEIIEKIYLGYIGVAVWNKIYSKDMLKRNNIRFNENFWFAEGMLFNIMCLQYVDEVAIGSRGVYHMIENPNSATRKFNLDSWFCGLKSMEYQRDHWKRVTPNIQMAWEYHYRNYAESILRGLIQINELENNRILADQCVSTLKHNLKIPLQVSIGVWRKTEAICLAINPILVLSGVTKFSNCKTIKEKRDLLTIKMIQKTPTRLKKIVYSIIENDCKKSYKPFYLNRGLL